MALSVLFVLLTAVVAQAKADDGHASNAAEFMKKEDVLALLDRYEGRKGGEARSVLATLDLEEYGPALEREGIVTKSDIMNLSEDVMIKYLGITTLGARLKLLKWIEDQKDASEVVEVELPPGSSAPPAADRRAEMAEFFAGLCPSPAERRREIAAVVSSVIAEREEELLRRVSALIMKASGGGGGGGGAPRRALQEQQGGDAQTAGNVEHATLWLSDDSARVVMGESADTSFFRASAGVLSTDGAVRVGEAPDDKCTNEEDLGTLRWFKDKEVLQVCGKAQQWRAAGGAVLDAAEGEACNADSAGFLQFHHDQNLLEVCDGAGTWMNIPLAGPAHQALGASAIMLAAPSLALTGQLRIGMDANIACSADTDGTMRWHSEEGLLQVCVGSKEKYTAIYEPPPREPDGGVKQYSGNFLIVLFPGGPDQLKVYGDGVADVLMVGGGGGGGGRHGGGGGAGGVIYMPSIDILEGQWDVNVGRGGAEIYGDNKAGNQGEDSVFLGETAGGGGGGGSHGGVHGLAGGSGGGAGHSVTNGGLSVQGDPVNHAGNGYGNAGANNPSGGNEASGGGGAGAGGQQAVGESFGGKGGDGVQIDILPNYCPQNSGCFWGGGGGGGSWSAQDPGAGGRGGGGAGGYAPGHDHNYFALGGADGLLRGEKTYQAMCKCVHSCGGAGAANTGGGGGGSGQANWEYHVEGRSCGAAGGSGIVVVRFACLSTWCQRMPDQPTGGNVKIVTADGVKWRVHTFLSSGTFKTSAAIHADVLMVGGGGAGGGRHGGGGGGGGVMHMPGIKIGAGTWPVAVGAGGAAVFGHVQGNAGADTTFIDEVAKGGGGGGTHAGSPTHDGGPGGSGGGGGHSDANGGAATQQDPTAHFGRGYGFPGMKNPSGGNEASGGGGASEEGQESGDGAGGDKFAGRGGAGRLINMDGNDYYWGGGGGGGSWSESPPGAGGIGGGGAGGFAPGTSGHLWAGGGGYAINAGGQTQMRTCGCANSCGGAGGANSGGGGGGSGQANWGSYTSISVSCGAAGGSGIVIVRYRCVNGWC